MQVEERRSEELQGRGKGGAGRQPERAWPADRSGMPLTVVVDVAQDAQQLPGAGTEAVERVRAVGVGQQQAAEGGGQGRKGGWVNRAPTPKQLPARTRPLASPMVAMPPSPAQPINQSHSKLTA